MGLAGGREEFGVRSLVVRSDDRPALEQCVLHQAGLGAGVVLGIGNARAQPVRRGTRGADAVLRGLVGDKRAGPLAGPRDVGHHDRRHVGTGVAPVVGRLVLDLPRVHGHRDAVRAHRDRSRGEDRAVGEARDAGRHRVERVGGRQRHRHGGAARCRAHDRDAAQPEDCPHPAIHPGLPTSSRRLGARHRTSPAVTFAARRLSWE